MDSNSKLMKADLALAEYGDMIRSGGRVQVMAGKASLITRYTEDHGNVVLHDKIPDWIDGVALYKHYTPWYLALTNNSSHDGQQVKDARKWAPSQIGIVNFISAGTEYYHNAAAIKNGEPGHYKWVHGAQPFPNMVAAILPYRGLPGMYLHNTRGDPTPLSNLYDADLIAVCPGGFPELIDVEPYGQVVAHPVGGIINDLGEFEPNRNSIWRGGQRQTFVVPGSASSSVGEVAGALAVLRLLSDSLDLQLLNRELLQILSDTAEEVDVRYDGKVSRERVLIDLLAACDAVAAMADSGSLKPLSEITLPDPEPVPPPQPEPAPEPEPEPMSIYEDDYIRVTCPARLVNGPNQKRGNKREGLANMFTDDRKKTLFWQSPVTINVTAKQGPMILDLYRAGNDDERFPERSLSKISVDDISNTPILPVTDFFEQKLDIPVPAGESTLSLHSDGPLMQVSYLRFRPEELKPDPEPEPTYVETAVAIECEDGETREVFLSSPVTSVCIEQEGETEPITIHIES